MNGRKDTNDRFVAVISGSFAHYEKTSPGICSTDHQRSGAIKLLVNVRHSRAVTSWAACIASQRAWVKSRILSSSMCTLEAARSSPVCYFLTSMGKARLNSGSWASACCSHKTFFLM